MAKSESAKCVCFSLRKTVFHTDTLTTLITDRLLGKIYMEMKHRRWNYKGVNGKGSERMKGEIYWAQVWKGGACTLKRWDKENWQGTMHKMKRKKMERRTHVEEDTNSLMLGAVWSTFRFTRKANIPKFRSACLGKSVHSYLRPSLKWNIWTRSERCCSGCSH